MKCIVGIMGGPLGRTGAMFVLAAAGLASVAAAQQGGEQANLIQTGWVKLCKTFTLTMKNKDGKDEEKNRRICLTQNRILDANSGRVRYSAAIRVADGDAKQHLTVTVPLGMKLQPGMRATVYSKDDWEKSQKGDKGGKIDEAKLKPLTLAYTLCHAGGCDGELDTTPPLLNDLKTGGALMLFAINESGVSASFPVPLAGFDKAYADAPMSDEKYSELHRQLTLQIQQQQKFKATIIVPQKQP